MLDLLIFLNLFALALMGYDKRCAKRRQRRIPESALLLCAIFGGSVGIYAGIWLFRHKIRKARFRILLPFLLAAQGFILYMMYNRLQI